MTQFSYLKRKDFQVLWVFKPKSLKGLETLVNIDDLYMQ